MIKTRSNFKLCGEDIILKFNRLIAHIILQQFTTKHLSHFLQLTTQQFFHSLQLNQTNLQSYSISNDSFLSYCNIRHEAGSNDRLCLSPSGPRYVTFLSSPQPLAF
jgi:hypothetical protein